MLVGIRQGAPLVAAAAVVLANASPARAAEAYLCGPDTVVYVEANELEHKKRTDPCIAGYYGLTIAPAPVAAPAAAPAAKKSAPRAVAAKTPSLPAATAERVAALAPPATKATVTKASDTKAAPFPTSPVTAAPAAAVEKITVASVAPAADFRNVRILNAKSQKAAWFRHEK